MLGRACQVVSLLTEREKSRDVEGETRKNKLQALKDSQKGDWKGGFCHTNRKLRGGSEGKRLKKKLKIIAKDNEGSGTKGGQNDSGGIRLLKDRSTQEGGISSDQKAILLRAHRSKRRKKKRVKTANGRGHQNRLTEKP